MIIHINEDVEAGDFKENFFMHFSRRETGFIVTALITGIAVYLVCMLVGLEKEQTTLFMVVFVLPVLLAGFYHTQGLSFRDYIRKYILLRICKNLVCRSTEDPWPDEIAEVRIKEIRERRDRPHVETGKIDG